MSQKNLLLLGLIQKLVKFRLSRHNLSTGEMEWSTEIERFGNQISAPISLGDKIVVATYFGSVKFLDAGTGVIEWDSGEVDPGGIGVTPMIADGRLTVVGKNGIINQWVIGVPECTGLTSTFIRGDANSDRAVNLSDAVYLLNFLFLSGEAPSCQKAADANDNGSLEISDAIHILNYLFHNGTMPEPGPEEGIDPTPDNLSCG